MLVCVCLSLVVGPILDHAQGGAIYISGGTASLTSCTFSANTAVSGTGERTVRRGHAKAVALVRGGERVKEGHERRESESARADEGAERGEQRTRAMGAADWLHASCLSCFCGVDGAVRLRMNDGTPTTNDGDDTDGADSLPACLRASRTMMMMAMMAMMAVSG